MNYRASSTPRRRHQLYRKPGRQDQMGQPYPRHGRLDRQADVGRHRGALQPLRPGPAVDRRAALCSRRSSSARSPCWMPEPARACGISIPATSSPPARSPTCVDGRQYFAIISATNVFSFGLPDAGAKGKPLLIALFSVIVSAAQANSGLPMAQRSRHRAGQGAVRPALHRLSWRQWRRRAIARRPS